MKKLYSILNAVFIVIITILMLIDRGNANTITVYNEPIKVVDDYHYKTASFGRIGIYADYFNDLNKRKAVEQLFKDYDIKTLRLHHPVFQHYNAPFSSWAGLTKYGSGPLKSIVDDMEFIKWCKKNNFKVILQLNTSNYYDQKINSIVLLNDHPEYIEKLVYDDIKFLSNLKKKDLLRTILYVELGNEDYVGMVNYPGTYPEIYSRIVADIILHAKTVLPEIKFCIVGQSPDFNIRVPKDKGNWTVAEWMNTAYTELKKMGLTDADIDYVAQHSYADDQVSATKLSKGNRRSATDIPAPNADWQIYKTYKISETGSIYPLSEFLDNFGFKSTRIEVNEFRRGGFNSYYNRSYMNLLANLDPWISFLNDRRVSGTLMWDTFNGADLYLKNNFWDMPSGYGVFIVTPDGFKVTMPGYLYLIMAKAMKSGDIVLRTSERSCVALQGNNRINIIYYSKNNKYENIDLAMVGFNSSAKKIIQTTYYRNNVAEFTYDPYAKKKSSILIDTKHVRLKSNITIKPFSINIISIYM